MKRLLMSGSILLTSFALCLAGGVTPRREDVPKYLEMLKTSPKRRRSGPGGGHARQTRGGQRERRGRCGGAVADGPEEATRI